ncbi:AT-hook motif nuclear-localized protein 9-like [Hordeum vulgare]|nr:AT-hook motif nuclear-localized protein 9-like [Hordeum vulgare]
MQEREANKEMSLAVKHIDHAVAACSHFADPKEVARLAELSDKHVYLGVEDVASRIMSFSQQGPRAVCILLASGALSRATLHQDTGSDSVVKYELLTKFGFTMNNRTGMFLSERIRKNY